MPAADLGEYVQFEAVDVARVGKQMRNRNQAEAANEQ